MKKSLSITILFFICLGNVLNLTLKSEIKIRDDELNQSQLNNQKKNIVKTNKNNLNEKEDNLSSKVKRLKKIQTRNKGNKLTFVSFDNNTNTSQTTSANQSSLNQTSLNQTSLNQTSLNQTSNFINSLGNEVDVPIIVDKPPYELTRCDQIVSFAAAYVPDLDDYAKRVNGFFTITAYYINLLEENDASKLKQSILLSNSRTPPIEPIGAENCLLIDGGANENQMLLCANDTVSYTNYKSVLSTFDECRQGNLPNQDATNQSNQANSTSAQPSTPSMADLSKSCGFDGSMSPDELLKKQNAKNDASDANSKANEKFWVPGGDKVPGTPVNATDSNDTDQ